MRYLVLASNEDSQREEPLLHNFRISLSNKDFITSGRLFLSVLAAISEEELEQLRPHLLPHKVTVDSQPNNLALGSSFRTCDTDRANLYQTDTTYSQPPKESGMTGSIHPSISHQLSTPSISNDRDLFSRYTTSFDDDTNVFSWGQVVASRQGLDTSRRQSVAHSEVSEHGGVDVVLDPLLVTPLMERDGDASLLDSQATARPQLYRDSVDVDMTSDSCQDESTGEHLEVGTVATTDLHHRQTKRNHPTILDCVTKRARTPGGTQEQPSSITIHAQSRDNTASHYLRSYDALTSKYGENTDSGLKPAQVINAIKVGDSFLLDNPVEFVTTYLENCRAGIWNTPVLCPPLNGSINENLFKSFRCAEILDQRTVVDPIRLRVARVLLFWYYEQLHNELCGTPEVLSRCSPGRDTASIVTDMLQEEIFHLQKGQCSEQEWQKRRASLQKQKQIGKRWSTLISCIGPGLLLICSPDLATYINNGTFSEGVIQAFLHYVVNTYPQGVSTCKMLDPLSRCIMKGGPFSDYWPDSGILNMLRSYAQVEEKESTEFKENWISVEAGVGSISTVLS